MSLRTKPSARSAFTPTSFAAPIGAPSPDATRPASITVSSGAGPEPSIWKLQRMHGPSLGIPCGSGRPVGLLSGSCPGPGPRADHGHERLRVGAVVLVGIGHRSRALLGGRAARARDLALRDGQRVRLADDPHAALPVAGL